MHHPILAYLKDPAEIRREVRECRTALEQQLGHHVGMFAYPFGQPGEVGDKASQAVCEVGYDCVLTTIHDINPVRSHPHELRRIYADVSRHWLMMAVETTGLWKYFSSLNPFRRILIRRMVKITKCVGSIINRIITKSCLKRHHGTFTLEQ